MGQPKGSTGNPNGRPVGSQNKDLKEVRHAIALFVDGNAHRLERWLDQIAKDNPMAAFDRYMSVLEYYIPKLQRTEVTGKDGERLNITVVTGLPAIDADYQVIQPLAVDARGQQYVESGKNEPN